MSVAHAGSIAEALEALGGGEPVVYPTETFYGVGVDAFSSAALERLFAIKRREADKPVALIAADIHMAFALAREIPDAARILARTFWPGPLTLVMPARNIVPEPLVGPDGGVGVRVSAHPVARELAARLGQPITATSANLAGNPPATTLSEAHAAFGDRVRIYLDGGKLGASAPSTVIVIDRSGWRVVRAGAISQDEIAAALAAKDLE